MTIVSSQVLVRKASLSHHEGSFANYLRMIPVRIPHDSIKHFAVANDSRERVLGDIVALEIRIWDDDPRSNEGSQLSKVRLRLAVWIPTEYQTNLWENYRHLKSTPSQSMSMSAVK
jgi:hypothetical protein